MLGRSFMLSSLSVLRLLSTFALWLIILAFLVLFGLQFWSPPQVDSYGPVVVLRQWGDPVLARLDSWLELPKPATPYIPLGLALLIIGIEGLLSGILAEISDRLARAIPGGRGGSQVTYLAPSAKDEEIPLYTPSYGATPADEPPGNLYREIK